MARKPISSESTSGDFYFAPRSTVKDYLFTTRTSPRQSFSNWTLESNAPRAPGESACAASGWRPFPVRVAAAPYSRICIWQSRCWRKPLSNVTSVYPAARPNALRYASVQKLGPDLARFEAMRQCCSSSAGSGTIRNRLSFKYASTVLQAREAVSASLAMT